MKCWKILGLALCSLLASAASLTAQTTLQFKFKEGDTLNYEIQQKAKQTTKVMDMDIESTMDQSMEMSWKILKVNEDGSARVQIKFGRARMSITAPMVKIDVDSKDENEPDDPAGKVMSQVIRALAAIEMTFTMQPNGEMQDVKIPDAVKARLKKLPNPEGMGDLLSEDGLKKMVQGGMILPKGPVTKGKTWEQKVDMKMPFGKMSGAVQFTYEGPETKGGVTLEKIALKPNVKIEADGKNKMQIKEQDGKGYAYFDAAAGRIVAVDQNNTMVMAIEAAANVSITQRTVQIMTMRLKK